MCAAQERLALPALTELAEVQEPASYRLLTSEWRPFITVTLENDGEHFELYHASLRDFFSGSVSLDDLTSGEQAFGNELRTATRMRHRRIAARYQQQWGGATLEKLREERDVGYRNSYGWRHVVAHLVHGEDDEALMNLLKTEWNFEEKVPNLMPGWAGRLIDWTGRRPITRLGIPRSGWFESHARAGDLALFLLDWDRAGQMAAARKDVDGAFHGRHMVLEIAAYLVKSSVRDAALRVPFGVVTALVRCGRWSIDQAIAYARHVADRATSAELLTELATLDSSSRPHVIREALEAIDGLEDLGERATALIRLLETGLTDHAVVTRNVFDVLRQLDASALVEHGPRVIPYLADSEWPEYLSLVDGLRTPLLRLRTLTASAARLPDASRLQDRLSVARGESERQLDAAGGEDEGERSLTLAILASLSAGSEAASYAEQALESVDVAIRTTEGALAEEPYEALAVVSSVFPERIPARLLASTLQRLLAIRQPGAVTPFDVIASLQGVTTMEQHRSKLAAKLIAIAPRRTLRTMEKAVVRTKVRFGDWDAYRNLAIRCAQLGDTRRALRVARRIELAAVRQQTLATIAPHLDEAALRRALAIADADRTRLVRRKVYESMRHLEAEQARATLVALTGLLPRLAELGREDEALGRLRVLRSAGQEPEWRQIVSGLARHVSEQALNELLRMSMAFQDTEQGVVEMMELAPYLSADKVRGFIPACRIIGYSENTIDRISWMRVQRSTSGIRDLGLRRSALHAIALRLAELGHYQEPLGELVLFLQDAAKGRSSTNVADCLGGIARLMPPASWKQTLLVAAAHDDQTRPRALQAIVSTLPVEALDEALTVARSVTEEGCRAWGIGCLLPLADGQRRASLAREAWELLREPFWDRSHVLGLLAPHVDEALDEIRVDVCSATDRGLTSLVQFLPIASGSRLQEMIDFAVDSYDEGPLLDLAEFLPESTFRDILDRVVETTPAALYKHDGRLASVSRRLIDLNDTKPAFMCALEIRDRYRRVRATHHAAAALRQLPHEELLALWRMASPLSRQSTRQHAFQFAAALGPLAFALGGDEAIQRLYATIAETSRWWY